MNILEEANKIVNLRSEEKERQYGPMQDGIKRAADIAKLMSGKDLTEDDIYICLIALKLSRQSYNHKEDNLLDAVAYMGAWNDYKNNKDK